MPDDLKHSTAESLQRTADDCLRRFSERLHEVPSKDLPACAALLLELRARLKQPKKSKNNEPLEAS